MYANIVNILQNKENYTDENVCKKKYISKNMYEMCKNKHQNDKDFYNCIYDNVKKNPGNLCCTNTYDDNIKDIDICNEDMSEVSCREKSEYNWCEKRDSMSWYNHVGIIMTVFGTILLIISIVKRNDWKKLYGARIIISVALIGVGLYLSMYKVNRVRVQRPLFADGGCGSDCDLTGKSLILRCNDNLECVRHPLRPKSSELGICQDFSENTKDPDEEV